MGMYSNYYIKVEDFGCECDLEEVKDALHKIAEYTFYVSNDIIHSSDEMKWYGYEEDMVKLSEAFPKLRFKVFRDYEEGCYMEESGNIKNTHEYNEFQSGKQHEFEINISLRPL